MPQRWLVLSKFEKTEYIPVAREIIASTRDQQKTNSFSIAVATGKRVLCGGEGTDTIDAFRVANKVLRSEGVISLPVKFNCFTSDGQSLLIVSRHASHFVIIFRIRGWENGPTASSTEGLINFAMCNLRIRITYPIHTRIIDYLNIMLASQIFSQIH